MHYPLYDTGDVLGYAILTVELGIEDEDPSHISSRLRP